VQSSIYGCFSGLIFLGISSILPKIKNKNKKFPPSTFKKESLFFKKNQRLNHFYICIIYFQTDGEYDGDFLKYFKKGFRSSFASPISTVEGFEDYSERRTSEVWKHFLLNKAMEKAKCKHCSELLSVVTTTLKNHLKMKHQIFVKSLRDDRPVRFSSDSYRGTGGHAGQDSYGGAGGGHHAGQTSGDITGHSELPQ